MRSIAMFLLASFLLSGCASDDPLPADLPATAPEETGNLTQAVTQHAEGAIDGESLVCHGAPDTGTGKAAIDIEPATWGGPFSLAFRSGAAHDLYRFVDDGGSVLLEGGGGLSQGMSWTFTGDVPEGATQLVMFACQNTFGEGYTYDAEAA